MNSASTVASTPNLNAIQNTQLPDYNSAIQNVVDITNSNNAQARFNASEQRAFAERMANQTNAYNAAEAAKNRDWQSMMSNTAHQREIKDLKAAGLNPILSAMGGNGAAVTSGATASGVSGQSSSAPVDTSANAAIVGLMGNMLSAQTKLAEMSTSAMTNLATADKYTSMNEIVANIARSASLGSASIYGQTSRDVESSRQAHDKNMRESYPSTFAGIVSALTSPSGGISSAIDSVLNTGQSVVGKIKDYINNLSSKGAIERAKESYEEMKDKSRPNYKLWPWS